MHNAELSLVLPCHQLNHKLLDLQSNLLDSNPNRVKLRRFQDWARNADPLRSLRPWSENDIPRPVMHLHSDELPKVDLLPLDVMNIESCQYVRSDCAHLCVREAKH